MTFKDGCNQGFGVGEENLDNYALLPIGAGNLG